MKKLKAGVHLYQSHGSVQERATSHIGARSQGLHLNSPEAASAARALIPSYPEELSADLAARLSIFDAQCNIDAHKNLLAALESSGLIDTEESSIKLTKRSAETISVRDASYQQLRTRIAPELSQLTWSGNSDGGVAELSARQIYSIELSGNSRVVAILFTLLLASGVTDVRISQSTRQNSPLVGDLDLGTPFIAVNEIGLNYRSHMEALRTQLSLFPLDKDCRYTEPFLRPDLKIHCGEIDPEVQALWMSSNQPHLIIDSAHSGEVIIGPLVEPGITPCNRCLSLVERDNFGYSRDQAIALSPMSDYPIAVAYYIASIVSDMAMRYCADKTFIKRKSELAGKIIQLSYQSALTSTLTAIARHPLCGCAFAAIATKGA